MDDDQRARIDAVARALEDDGRVRAAFLTGSLAAGDGDRWSDVDLLVFADDPAVVEDLGVEVVDRATRPLGAARLVNLVLATGDRVDVVVAPPSAAGETGWGTARATLFDRDGIEHRLPAPSPPFRVAHDEDWIRSLVDGFLRTLLLLPLVIERGELLRGRQHVQLLVQDLLELLLHRAGDPPLSRPGLWAWSELPERLPDDDRRLIETLPPLAASAESIVDGHRAVAAAFLPVAGQLLPGERWPHDYERATLGYLARHGYDLRISRPG